MSYKWVITIHILKLKLKLIIIQIHNVSLSIIDALSENFRRGRDQMMIAYLIFRLFAGMSCGWEILSDLAHLFQDTLSER